jgi:starch phosphorylase
VVKADIGGKDGTFKDTFWVTSEGGGKVAEQDIPAMTAALEALLASYSKPSASVRPKLSVPGASEDRQELLHTLMDTYVKNDVLSIQQSIVNREWQAENSERRGRQADDRQTGGSSSSSSSSSRMACRRCCSMTSGSEQHAAAATPHPPPAP